MISGTVSASELFCHSFKKFSVFRPPFKRRRKGGTAMENDVPLRSVDRYDGQVVWIRKHGAFYELGSYLGSGAAGVVYEAVNLKTNEVSQKC